MWYYVSEKPDAELEWIAKQYGEPLTFCESIPQSGELLFLHSEQRPTGSFPIRIGIDCGINEPLCNFSVHEPYDREQLIRIAKCLCKRPYRKSGGSLTEACLDALSVPIHLLGYRYLRIAIDTIRSNPFPQQQSMMHDIYPHVAKQYGSSPIMVNRAMRHAIDYAWRHGDPQAQRSYFGYGVPDKKGVPTNVEFLFAVCERLRLLEGQNHRPGK